jgi:hypothetical protein
VSLKEWGGGTYGLEGDEAVDARLLAVAEAFPGLVAQALVDEATFEMEDARAKAPIGASPHDPHPGKLRESGRVLPSVDSDGMGAGELSATIAFGGSDVMQAIPQHQKPSYQHPQGGEAFYLIGTLENAKGVMLGNVAARVEQGLVNLGATV